MISKLKSKNFLILAGLFTLCTVVNILLYIYLGGYSGLDLRGHWSICAHTLRGINPYTLIGEETFVDGLTDIPLGFSVVPWGCLLGNAFYGGFLSVTAAAVYNAVLHFLFLVAAVMVVKKCFSEYFKSKKQLILSLLILISHFSFMYSIYFGNAGGIICCMLIMSILLSENHPIPSALLLAVSMSKPQIAAIICIVFLLNKKFTVLGIAAAIDIAAWIGMGFLTDTNIIELLLQTFSSGTASDAQYLGLFSVLQYIGIPKMAVLAANVLFGVSYTVIMRLYLKSKGHEKGNSFVLYVPACIASVFWIYKNGTDYMILSFAVIFFVLMILKNNMNFKDTILSVLCIGYLQMSRCAVYLCIVLSKRHPLYTDLAKSMDGLIIGIIGVIFCVLWTKYHNTTELTNQNISTSKLSPS